MNISQNKVVSFHYRLNEAEADELESSRDGHPALMLFGHKNVLPALEEAFEGKTSGDIFTVSLSPDQAYGRRQEGATKRIPQKHLYHYKQLKNKLKPGMKVSVATEKGARDVIVTKVGKFSVDVDFNHPYAGKSLVFDIEIMDVRDASEDEIAHGHAHGDGGHNH
jgi:FKBP-type peptidyl-prolyl cis-trans isomerase SlyD